MFNEANFSKLAEFIYRKSGIFLEVSKHYDKINKFIVNRMDELGQDSFRKYFFRLRFEDAEGKEFQELMNAVTVNETYFFREHDQFEVLVNHVLPTPLRHVPRFIPQHPSLIRLLPKTSMEHLFCYKKLRISMIM